MIAKLKSLQNYQGFMKYFKNTSWLFAEKILRMVVGLFVGIWVARYLGPEQFGLFSYAQSFVGLFSTIAGLGLSGIIVRELVKDETRQNELIGTAFWLMLIGAIIVLCLLGVTINFTSNDTYTNTLVFIIASATIFQSFNVIDFYFQSKVLSKYVVYANIVSLLLSSILKVILILKGAPLIAFAWVVLFDSFVLAIGYIYFYFNKNSKFNIKNLIFNKLMAIKLLKDSWPLILSGVVVSIYMKIDQVMIKEMMNSESVGLYAAATRISEAWYFVPMVIVSSLFPSIINAKENNKNLYESRMQNLYSLLIFLAILIAIPVTFLGNNIIDFLYGAKFYGAGIVLIIHIWIGLFLSLSIIRGKWQILENLTKLHMYGAIIAVITNIIFNYILIQYYGIAGAAFASLLASFISGYLMNFMFKELRNQLYFIHRFYKIYRNNR